MIKRFDNSLLNNIFDVAIIGGGVNGCGIARDAAERGLRVILLEKEDFAYGCTSASTRLIHGGLRYLENLEFDLVRESLREREILLKNAKHLVKPLELLIPIYSWNRHNYLKIKAGMLLYDVLSYDKSLPGHKMFNKNSLASFEPSIKTDFLTGGVVYYDSQVQFPERLTLENILMAKNYGAFVLNHAEVVDLKIESKKISIISFLDKLTNRKYDVAAKLVINVAGPWLDNLCGLTKLNIKRITLGTKGSHIIIKRFEGGPKHAIYVEAKSDGRPFFIVPWMNDNKEELYLIGTTDIPFNDDLDSLAITKDEIDYLISEANNVLKIKTIKLSDILYSYSGVRPLLYSNESNVGKITRKHIILDHASDGIDNFVSVIGGKLTTYRNLSEEVVNLVYKKLVYKKNGCKTKEIPLVGNIPLNTDISFFKRQVFSSNAYDTHILSNLIDLYGIRFKDLLEFCRVDSSLKDFLSFDSYDIKAQVKYSILNEMAFTVSDVLLRRLTLGLCPNLGEEAIHYVADELQTFYDYSEDEIAKQKKYYLENVIGLRTGSSQ